MIIFYYLYVSVSGGVTGLKVLQGTWGDFNRTYLETCIIITN